VSAAEKSPFSPIGSILKFALDYANRGFPVFPCNPINKRPFPKGDIDPATGKTIDGTGGFKKALVLIIIDTLSASADFTDANYAAEGQRVMNRLNELSRRTGAFTLAVDHFGKVVETGTRGTSAKEAAADVVLALLADRDIAGNVSHTRLAVRKLRGGATGAEIPFDLRVVDLGDGVTTCIIE
jgi:hypothetical protein